MKSKGLLVVISGPSGAGKGSICRELLRISNNDLELSVSVTTRKPREGEVQGVNYFFSNEEEFKEMIESGGFIEYANVHGNYYGTPKKYVLDKLEEGKSVILEIDVQGGMKIKSIFEDAVFIFILPPSLEELRKRIEGRGTESEQDICRRMNNAYGEISYARNYDYVVVNDNVKDAAAKIDCILTAEKCRIGRCNIDFEKFREV